MADQGQQQELTLDLIRACRDNNQARAEQLLEQGADPHALLRSIGWNALHMACVSGHVHIVNVLLDAGVWLESRDAANATALLLASIYNKPEVCFLLLAKGAELHAMNNRNETAVTHYGEWAIIDATVKAQRVAELEAAFRAGCHPSQVQRRKDEAWARRGAFLQVMAENRFQPLLHILMADLHTALPTDAKLPDEPTETEEERRALLHRKVFGLEQVVRGVAGFM